MRWKSLALEDIPRPTERLFVTVHGEPTLECVALGNGPITGWGVASHEVGFVGAFARALAHRFERGVAVRGTIDPDLRVSTMRAAAEGLPWRSAQVGLLAFGPMEIPDSTSARDWQDDLALLITDVHTRMSTGSVLVVLGIPPLSTLSTLHGAGGGMLDRLIHRYNHMAASVCADVAGVQFVQLPDPGPTPRTQYRSPENYTLWADVVAAHIAVDLAAVELPHPSDELRFRAVEALGILDTSPSDERFDRVVRLARSVFGTKSASFTVLHGSLQWDKAKVGLDRTTLPRDQSICEIAVGQSGPLVIGDTWKDPRFDDNAHVREGEGVRFYAGYPLRAPDGNFIGALCVFDPKPRDPRDVDVASLRDLALMIEETLEGPRLGSAA